MFWLLIGWIALTVLSYLLTRPAKTKVTAPGAFDPPQVPAGTPIPVAFGLVKTEPIICQFSYRLTPLKTEPGDVIVGYNRKVSYLGLLAWGPIHEWQDIIFDDTKKLSAQGTQKTITALQNTYPFTVTYGTTPAISAAVMNGGHDHAYAEIYLPNLFGGFEVPGEGGIKDGQNDFLPRFDTCQGRFVFGGQYHFFWGAPGFLGAPQPPIDDVINLGTPPKDGDCNPVPTTSGTGRIRYERFAYTFLNDVNIGLSPQMKKQEHVILSDIGGTFGTPGDADPIGVILEILLNPEWGLGISPALIDRGAFAAAGLLLTDINGGESFGISGIMRDQQPAEDYIGEILRTVDAVLYRDPATGLLSIQTIRGGYSVGSLPDLDESNVKELEWTRRDIADTVNEITVAYTDRDRLFNRNVVTVQDHANIHATGGVRSQTFEFPYIPTEAWALKVAARELKSNTLPLGRGTLVCTRDVWDAVPGDVFKLSWARYGIVDLPVRVLSVSQGTLENGLVEMTIVEDLYGLPEVPYSVNTDPWTDPAAVPRVPVTVTVAQSDDGIDGEATLNILNAEPVTLVEFSTQSGRDLPGSYGAVSGSGGQWTSPTVALSASDPSFIYWRVTYTDELGDDQTLSGTVTFAASSVGSTTTSGALFDDAGILIPDDDGNTIFAG